MIRFSTLATALVFVLALLSGGPARATPADDFDSANQAYSDGRYDEAAITLRKLVAEHGYSAPLCYNLANAEAKAGHLGQAILDYERARYLAPNDEAIDHNLQLARQKAGLQPNSLRWWQIVLRQLTITQWLTIVDLWLALIALAVLTHAFATTVSSALHLSESVLRRIIKGVFFVGIPGFLFFSYVALMAAPLRIEGVIVADKQATLRLSPFDGAEKVGTIPEGELVTVEQRHDDYYRIDARNQHFGWVQKQDLEPVIAGSLDGK